MLTVVRTGIGNEPVSTLIDGVKRFDNPHTYPVGLETRLHELRTRLILDKNREGPNRVVMNVEMNFATGVWREGMADEERLWIPDR